MNNYKKYFFTNILMILLLLVLAGGITAIVDPFFVYHKPLAHFKYEPGNPDEYYVIPGMARNFDYDAIICGTCMSENFKNSEFDKIFGTKSIKATIENSGYYETTRGLEIALRSHKVKVVLRSLDMSSFLSDPKAIGRIYEYKTTDYLWNNNPFDDVKYVFNKDVLIKKTLPVLKTFSSDSTYKFDMDNSFAWSERLSDKRGAYNVMKIAKADGMKLPFYYNEGEQTSLTKEEKQLIKQNVEQNFLTLAEKYPDTEFICFVTPYSALFWGNLIRQGSLIKWTEAERYIIGLLLKYDNIKVYSLNLNAEYVANLNNYIDPYHYLGDMNEMVLMCIEDDRNRITKDTLDAYISEEQKLYSNFDYVSMLVQTAPMQPEFTDLYI